jgi:two-component system, NarL family, sensor histidine kinase DesK
MSRIARFFAFPWVPPYLGKAPYLWAFSLSFFFWKYLYIPPSAFELTLAILTALLFLPLYFAGYWLEGRKSLLMILATFAIGAAWAPVNFSSNTFFIFAAGMCAGIANTRLAYVGVVVVMLAAVGVGLAAGTPARFLIPSLAIGLPVGLASVMEASLRRSREQLLRKQEEVEHMATIAERERISRDLHDLLGHTLSLITLKAELAGKLAARDIDACKREIGDIERSARNALAEVRAAVTGYRAVGFAHELASARASLAAAGVTMHEQVEALALPAVAENVMALALREAVTNIIRHAEASRCDVIVREEQGVILFRIADNGALRADAAALRHGNGLNGMKERVAAIGGQLALVAGHGLALELRLPTGGAA